MPIFDTGVYSELGCQLITSTKNLNPLIHDICINPNPITQSSILTYQLPSRTSVNIKVYDYTGREVSTLMNGTQEKGNYKINLNPNNYKAGMYFIKLETNNNISTLKFIKE